MIRARRARSSDRSQIPAWARISRAFGNSPASSTACRPSAGNPAAGVDQHRQLALVGERDQLPHVRMVERELLGAGVELDPASPGREAALGLGDGVVVRVHAAEGHEQPVRFPRRLDHGVVGRRVAVGLVHREHERAAGAGQLQAREQLLGGLAHPVGVVLADVRVGVEQLDAGHLLEHDLGPGLEHVDQVHRVIRTMNTP